MNQTVPSIFSDVLGPVMRGPSSSHTAGSYRIGLLLRDLANGKPLRAHFEFHPGGSLATTYQTHGSDLGLAAGLAGMSIIDPEMPSALKHARNQGQDITFAIVGYETDHPNTYRCMLQDQDGVTATMTALSTGGGMIRVISLMGFPVGFDGSDTLLFGILKEEKGNLKHKEIEEALNAIPDFIGLDWVQGDAGVALSCRFGKLPAFEAHEALFRSVFSFHRILKPVMPVPGYRDTPLPFSGFADLLEHPEWLKLPASRLARQFESARSGCPVDQLDQLMNDLIGIWRAGISEGLKGTRYNDRLVGSWSPVFMQKNQAGLLIDAGPLNRMIAYSSALMEVKSSMGVIIAAPTAGACGGLPGCLIGYADHLADDSKLMDGFWAAGLAGLFIAHQATFAAEVAGCQAETGAGAAMAAAGLVEMAGGNAEQAFEAASMALQNIMGLVCDPVANRVEIPCLGRNAAAAANALTSANMILGGMKAVIPFHETIDTMLATGRSLPAALRCTAFGGLSDTPTARRLEEEMKQPRVWKTM